jgi:hypothetical protein
MAAKRRRRRTSDLRVSLPLDPCVISPVPTTLAFAPRDLGVGGRRPRVLMNHHAGLWRICVCLGRVPAHEAHASDPCRRACGSEGERTCAQRCTEKCFAEGHRLHSVRDSQMHENTNTRRSSGERVQNEADKEEAFQTLSDHRSNLFIVHRQSETRWGSTKFPPTLLVRPRLSWRGCSCRTSRETSSNLRWPGGSKYRSVELALFSQRSAGGGV